MKNEMSTEVIKRRLTWQETHRKEHNASSRKWQIANPKKKKKNEHETNRKGGRYYQWKLKYLATGLPGERHRIRRRHGKRWRKYKQIIAPDSQLHHEWIPETAEYRGVALVEAKAHQYGIIDVILILDGKITVLTEEQIKKGKGGE